MNGARARPPNIRRAITIYVRWEDAASGLVRPMRRVLHNVFFAEESNAVMLRTGALSRESLFLQCFLEPDIEYVPLHVWKELAEAELGGKWSADDLSPQSIVVNHETSFEFPWGMTAQITQQENAFVRDTPGAQRIQKVEPRLIGTARGMHVSLRA